MTRPGRPARTSKPLPDLKEEEAKAELFSGPRDKAFRLPGLAKLPRADGGWVIEYWSGGTMATGHRHAQVCAQAALGFLDEKDFSEWQARLAADFRLGPVDPWFSFDFSSFPWHQLGLDERRPQLALVLPSGKAHEVVALAGWMAGGPEQEKYVLQSLGLVGWDGKRCAEASLFRQLPADKQLRFANRLATTVAKAAVVVARSKAPEQGRRKAAEALSHLGSPRAHDAVRWLWHHEPEHAEALKRRLNSGSAKERKDLAAKDAGKALACADKTVRLICGAFGGRWSR